VDTFTTSRKHVVPDLQASINRVSWAKQYNKEEIREADDSRTGIVIDLEYLFWAELANRFAV